MCATDHSTPARQLRTWDAVPSDCPFISQQLLCSTLLFFKLNFGIIKEKNKVICITFCLERQLYFLVTGPALRAWRAGQGLGWEPLLPASLVILRVPALGSGGEEQYVFVSSGHSGRP